jgi:hypothetical protein
MDLKKKIFKVSQFFNKSEAMATIFDIGQGHETYFGRGPSKEYHIQVYSNFVRWFLRRSKCNKLMDK